MASTPYPHSQFRTRQQPSTPPHPISPTRRPLYSHNVEQPSLLQSPFKSPRPSISRSTIHDDEEEEASLFLDSSPGIPFSPNITSSIASTAPSSFRTPVRRSKMRDESDINVFAMNSASQMIGTKRKSLNPYTTPLRTHTLTPLRTSVVPGSTNFQRLVPLPTPRFAPQTPTRNDSLSQPRTVVHLRQGSSSTKEDEDEKVFMDTKTLMRQESWGKKRGNSLLNAAAAAAGKGNSQDEVAEAVSPGGHITKRRARSRPVSLELLESVRSPSGSPPNLASSTTLKPRRSLGNSKTPIAFPVTPRFRTRTSSSSSSSDPGSPMPQRTRVSGGVGKLVPPNTTTRAAPLNRVESNSSASLFFGGPSITDPTNNTTPQRKRISTVASPNSPVRRQTRQTVSRPTIQSRHSFAGPLRDLNTRKSELLLDLEADVGEDEFFSPRSDTGPSFADFKWAQNTPSPRSKKTMIPKKFKPRDSGISISDDEALAGLDSLPTMPRASTSVNTIYSDDDVLVTPGLGPDEYSGWPLMHGSTSFGTLHGLGGRFDVDAFIMRTLAAGGKGSAEDGKKIVPGTPVKKQKSTKFDRPWQSAVAPKVGLRPGVVLPGMEDTKDKKGKKVAPRKSLPVAFPTISKPGLRTSLDSDSEGEELASPSAVNNKYNGLGMGRPGLGKPSALSNKHPSRWLLRRSSSGQFSSGGESLMGTPTKPNPKDGNRLATLFAESKPSLRSASSSSNSSIATINSPTPHVHTAHSPRKPSALSPTPARPTPAPTPTPTPPSRLERDFVEVEEVGQGEFGRVCKVRRKADGEQGPLFAIKKSKRFEGPKQRLRLREEVEILQHLSSKAGSNGRHPNVLAYIDSWEEDESLYIQTELCEFGNFGRFLCEYGKSCPQLDEARVWKIFAELSNGLCFIHDAGIIHMDLKPANIFVTGEGRFKIGDFGMASIWPRQNGKGEGFEREGDKLYLAPEVLQGKYGREADVFSLGMTMLETATNIIVPDQGDSWQRLRREDFSQIDLSTVSPELVSLIRSMMRTDPYLRVDIHRVVDHSVISRARGAMQAIYEDAKAAGESVFCASPLASVSEGFLDEILGHRPMDLSP